MKVSSTLKEAVMTIQRHRAAWLTMADVLRATFMVLRVKKNHHLIDKDSYQGVLLRYILSFCRGKYENMIENIKQFCYECRAAYIGAEYEETHPILRTCPKRWLCQLSRMNRDLPTPYLPLTKKEEEEWQSRFIPDPKELRTMTRNIGETITTIEAMEGYNTKIEHKSNLRWGKTSGCLEYTTERGGLLTTISERIPLGIKHELMKCSLYDIPDIQALIFKQLNAACSLEIEPFVHNCKFVNCEGKHPPLLKHTVFTRGAKKRPLTMFLSAINYLSSIVQRMLTEWLRNSLVPSESLESSPQWVTHIAKVYERLKKERKDIWFHSGDLVACTDNFVFKASQALAKKMLEPFERPDSWDNIISVGIGRFHLMLQTDELLELRRHGKYDEILDYVIENYQKYPLQIIGQHMGNPLSFPIMGGMHQAIATRVCELGHYRVTSEKPEIAQLYRRLWNGRGECTYILGLLDDGRLSKGPSKIQRTYEWLINIITREPTLSYETFYHKVNSPEAKKYVKKKEVESGNVEYKAWRWEDIKRIDNKPLSDLIFVHIRQKNDLIEYRSDSNVSFRTLRPDDKVYESMCYFRDNRRRDAKLRILLRPAYYWSCGDDHLGMTTDVERISMYKGTMLRKFNMKYSPKGDFISKEAFVIAEQYGRVKGGKVVKEIIVKMKQIALDHDSSSKWSWMDTCTSLRTQMTKEYYQERGRRSLKVYEAVENAQEVFVTIHWKGIMYMYENSIDPRLPRELGGYGLTTYQLPNTTNKVTRRHLKVLSWLGENNQYLAYKYGKKIRKLVKRNRTVTKYKWKRKFLYEHPGEVMVKVAEAKKLLNGYVGWISAIDSQTETTIVTGQQISAEVRSYVDTTYRDIKYHGSRYTSVSTSYGTERIPNRIYLGGMNCNKFYEDCLTDPREIGVSEEFNSLLKNLQNQQEITLEQLTFARVFSTEFITGIKKVPSYRSELELWDYHSPN
jgi:hypothetical protein